MKRRSLLLSSAVAAFAQAVPAARMKLNLSCGAIGIKATQRGAMDYASRYGFDSVEADGRYLSSINEAERRELLEYMKAKHLDWSLAGMPVEFRKDDAAFNESLKQLPAYSAGLRQAGVKRVTTWLTPTSAERTYLVNYRLHAKRLREMGRILEDNNLRFGVEYVGPKTSWGSQRFPFVHTMAEMRELFEEIKQPNIGLVLDSWHWWNAGESAEDILQLRPADIVSVDLNDAPVGIPKEQQMDGTRELPAATGVIDCKAFLNALAKIGFDGPVRAEPFNAAVRAMPPDGAVEASVTALKKAFAQIG